MKPKLTFVRASFHPLPGILHGLTLVAALVWLAMPAGAATRIWLGGDSGLWSDPDNWSPFGVPQNGDSLSFPGGGLTTEFSMINDLTGFTANTLTFTGAGYALNGNTLTLIQGITDNHSGALNRVRCGIQFTGSVGRFNSVDVGQLEIMGTTTLANNQDLIITALETNITVSGVIQGNGGLIKRGEGALFLRGSANNTYTGPTRFEGGATHLAKSSAARAISANVIIDGSTPGVPSVSDDLQGQYPPQLSVVITNGGYWYITNGATVTNLVLAEWGKIDGSGLLNLQCDVLVSRSDFPILDSIIDCALYLGDQSRTFRVSGSTALWVDGQIIGPGPGPNSPGIIKRGGARLYLTAANIYFGPTVVQGGELLVYHAGALGGSGAGAETSVETGILEFSGFPPMTIAETLVTDGGDIVFGGTVTLTGSLVLSNGCAMTGVNGNAVLEISSVISGPAAFSVEGGTVRLSGSSANTFGSAFSRVFVQPGFLFDFYPSIPTLELAKAGVAVPVPVTVSAFDTNVAVLRQLQDGGVSDVTIGHGGSWQFNGHTATPTALTFTGDGYVDTQGGLLLLTNPNTNQLRVLPGFPANYIAGISGRVSCGATSNIFVVDSNLFLNVAARVSGGAEIVKQGQGTMRLSSSNSFTGPVTVNEGILRAAHDFALGTTAAGTFVNRNGSLALDGGFDGIEIVGETLTLNSTNAAALTSIGLPVTNIWSGNIVLQRTAGISVPDAGGAFTHFGGNTTFDSSAISGPGGFTKSGPGALFITGLQGGNSYTGPTTVTGGLLEALRRGSLSGNIVVTGASSTLRTARAAGLFPTRTVLPFGASMTVQDGALWSMSGTNFETLSRLVGNGRLEISSGGALTVSNSVSCEFAGTFSGSGALNKLGLATFQVTGQSPSYTGPVAVSDGTYKVDGYFANSPVTVKLSSILRGSGAVGDVTVENGGVVRVDPRNATLGGSMQFNSVNFLSGGVLGAQFYGPHPTAGNDSLYVLNNVTLSTPTLSSGFGYPPREGDVITLIQKIAAAAGTGNFSGFPEGALRTIGPIPVVTSYVGGDGNDVTLTVTNLPLRAGGSQFVSSSSGNLLVPDDCGQLRLVVTNRSSTTVTNLRGTLRSLTAGVVVTFAESAFPNLAPNARGTNLAPFQIRTTPAFSCGAGVEFELVLTASNAPPIAILYTMVGTPGYSLQFDGRDARVDIPANTFSGVVNNFTIELWANPAGTRNVSPETNAGISVLLSRPNQRFAVFPDRGDLAYGVTHVSAGLSIGRNGISVFEHGTNRLLGTIHLPSRLVYSNAVSGWTHVALVYSSRQPRLYVNGALVRSGAASLFSSVHPSGSLGGSSQGDLGNFEGQLDEVRIWNTALDPSQIQTNMTRRLTGAEPNLVTYFRADEGGGLLLTDSAPASPNPAGTLLNGAAFVLAASAPITPPDADCLFRGGACESCFVATGTFTTNTPTLTELLSAEGSPSLCFPTRTCPGPLDIPNLPPTRYRQHSFTNTSSSEQCVTVQLHFDCPAAPNAALHVAAYLGTFDGSACANYLGDPGGDGTVPFSFHVPPRTNIVLVVTLRVGDIGCDHYALELFGLPCPPPRLDIAKDTAPNKVLLQWSSAYPDFRLQSVNAFDGSSPFGFGNVATPPSLVNGKFAVTNAITAPRQFFRLTK